MRCGFACALFLIRSATAWGADTAQPLAIQNVALSQIEDGPGVPASSYFVAGETIFFSFQIAGYRATGEDERSIKLSWRIEAKDPAGLLLVEPRTGTVAAGLAQEDKHWMPKVRLTISIPPFAPSGAYHVDVRIKDEIAKTDATKAIEFRVRGRDVESTPTLTLRDCHFYRTEDDTEAASVAAYRPGDTVWIRFEIAGFKLGEQNRFEVGYGIAVARPNGDILFQQPAAAVERDQSFYPRRYLPAALSLNLSKDLKAGQYTVLLSAEDKVGGQRAESRLTFSVEQ